MKISWRNNIEGFCKVYVLCTGPVVATDWLFIILFHKSSSCLYFSVTCFCLTISLQNISSYLITLVDISVLVSSFWRTLQVNIFCSVSKSSHPSGHVLSGYRPPKSFLMPLTVLVLRASSKLISSILKSGLFRYDDISNLSYFIFSILEWLCCSVFRYLNAASVTLIFSVDQYKVNCIAIQYKGVCIELNCWHFESPWIVLYFLNLNFYWIVLKLYWNLLVKN